MKKFEVVSQILGERLHSAPLHSSAKAFAPTNIALCKYWGKRDQELNLPVTSSLSISLGEKGSTTELIVSNDNHDVIYLNDQPIELFSSFGKRLTEYLSLFRKQGVPHFIIRTTSNIPVAAGMASSASGFASVIQALNQLFGWELTLKELSILARLGSGSACRSLWTGFVEWHEGVREDGMDSHGEPFEETWPELCVGLLTISSQEKAIGSREAMQRTLTTSPLYSAWPAKVSQDLIALKQAIMTRDFYQLGCTAESNALAMHATMLSAWPPILYCLPETITMMQKIWQLRHDGLPVYFTQDAGPNLKLLFLRENTAEVQKFFPGVELGS